MNKKSTTPKRTPGAMAKYLVLHKADPMRAAVRARDNAALRNDYDRVEYYRAVIVHLEMLQRTEGER